MRTKIVAGNWKMNLVKTEANALVETLVSQLSTFKLQENIKVILAPSFIYLEDTLKATKTNKQLFVSAQNCSDQLQGAFTGEVSASMLKSIGVEYVIIGHSERRQYYNEIDVVLLNKLNQALTQHITPIFCCGEPLEIRENNTYLEYIQNQFDNCLFQLPEEAILKTVIAYEPIWAIGTGKTASPAQAQEIHQFIRQRIAEKYNNTVAEQISILYGGSVNAKNAAQLFSEKDIDGALVGGASLKADDFLTIIQAI